MLKQWFQNLKTDKQRFRENLTKVSDIQAEILMKCLERNSFCEFGKRHEFAKIRTVDEFRAKVPISSYSDFYTSIEKMTQGCQNILCSEKVILFEPTSGTTSGTKLIPYTQSLKVEFQNGINAWLADILQTFPQIGEGSSYWSISPAATRNSFTKGGTKIGFEADSEYLNLDTKTANTLFAVPKEVATLNNIENFRYATAYFLLCDGDLSMISVWNPSFFTLILDFAEKHIISILRNIADGQITFPEAESNFTKKNKPLPKRASEIEKAFSKKNKWENVWKKLKLISCWSDSWAEFYAQQLTACFPNTCLQPKGLLSTEAMVSLPLFEAKGALPAYTSHFFEFLPENQTDSTFLIQQLAKNTFYNVIVTTGGGLYRYKTEDVVQVVDFYEEMPILKFSHRNRTCDLVGEKLEENFVALALKCAIDKVSQTFYMLAPCVENRETFYALFIETDIQDIDLLLIAQKIENELMQNIYYRQALELQQLQQLRVFRTNNAQTRFLEHQAKLGKIGNVKTPFFHNFVGWHKIFTGEFVV